MHLENKVFVVTGAGGGIGQELVVGLLCRGAKVVGVDYSEASLSRIEERVGGDAGRYLGVCMDITSSEAVQTLPARVEEAFGAVDGIINNAGIIQPFQPVQDISYESVDRVMNINFYGSLRMVKEFLPALRERPEAYIVNISSMGGFTPVPGQVIYGASKAAVKLLTEGLMSELANTNIGVSVVFPGAIETDITNNSGAKSPKRASGEKSKIKPLSPRGAAKIILNGIEKGKRKIIVGKDARFLDLLTRISSKLSADIIARKMGF